MPSLKFVLGMYLYFTLTFCLDRFRYSTPNVYDLARENSYGHLYTYEILQKHVVCCSSGLAGGVIFI